jgi:hypothetical protein
MIEWNDEREQRQELLRNHIADATSNTNRDKQMNQFIHLSDEPFQCNNALSSLFEH